MTFKDIEKIENESERIKQIYDVFDEETRLNTSQSSRIEFLTNTHHIDRHLKRGMRILDIGAGTGAYSLHYARQGYEVRAVELVEKHIESLKSKINDDMDLVAHQGTALDLSLFPDKHFDITLCFGPLYHLLTIDDQIKCIEESRRVTKDGGHIFYAFISNDMVVVTETMVYTPNFLVGDKIDRGTFKVEDFPFVFMTIDQIELLLKQSKIVDRIASDGLSELMAPKINAMSELEFESWYTFHLNCSNDPSKLGYSNHLMYIVAR